MQLEPESVSRRLHLSGNYFGVSIIQINEQSNDWCQGDLVLQFEPFWRQLNI